MTELKEPRLKRQPVGDDLKASIVALYTDGKATRTVAEELNVGYGTAYRVLKDAGVLREVPARAYQLKNRQRGKKEGSTK